MQNDHPFGTIDLYIQLMNLIRSTPSNQQKQTF